MASLCKEIFLLVLVLMGCLLQPRSVSAAVELSSDAGSEVCSGREVTFTCTASTNVVRWRSSESPANVLVESTTGMLPLGPFTVVAVTGNNTFLVSTATAAITEAVNGSLTCESFANTTDADSITVPGIKGPPSRTPNVTIRESTFTPVSEDEWEFVLEVMLPNCSLDYTYVATADPSLPSTSVPCGGTEDCRRCYNFTLELEAFYSFTSFVQNCGETQNGSGSVPREVLLELPGNVIGDTSGIKYEDELEGPGVLRNIFLTWSPVPDPTPTDDVDSSVTHYQISVTGIETTNMLLDSDAVCNGMCMYDIDDMDLPADGSADYTVSVTAMNVLGLGNSTTVGTYRHMENNFITGLYGNETVCNFIVTCSYFGGSFTVKLDSQPEGNLMCQTYGSQIVIVLANRNISDHTYMITGTVLSAAFEMEGSFTESDDCMAVGTIPTTTTTESGGGGVTVDPWIVFLIILVVLLTTAVVILGSALIYVIVLLRKKKGSINLTTPRETVEMKENMSYGPVRVQSQTATQEPVYEEADILQQPVNVHTGGNVAYGHIRP